MLLFGMRTLITVSYLWPWTYFPNNTTLLLLDLNIVSVVLLLWCVYRHMRVGLSFCNDNELSFFVLSFVLWSEVVLATHMQKYFGELYFIFILC